VFILVVHVLLRRRFYLEIEGKQRFKVVDCWEQDGYRVARPEYFTDSLPPTASEAQVSLHALCQSVDQLANVWLDKVRYYAQDVVLVWVMFMAVLLTFSRPSLSAVGSVQNHPPYGGAVLLQTQLLQWFERSLAVIAMQAVLL